MRGVSVFGLVVGMIVLGKAGAPGVAQEANPPGSYQQTCSDIAVKKENLYARCQDDKGKTHSAKLSHYEKCSEIVNKNGSLHCGAAGEGSKPSLPRGSYTESCRDIKMKGHTLHAICKSADGRETPATLRDANRCAQGVANVNGVLNCEVSDVLPPGSYISTCKDVRMQGTTLMASCDNGKSGSVAAELRDAHKCTGDILNDNGKLKCTPIKKVERR
jgi:CVNH domain